MSKDKVLEELFLAQEPHFDDKASFMAALIRRIEAVEYVRQYQGATIRRYKMAIVSAFVIGIISGAITLTVVLSMPAYIPLLTDYAQSHHLLWFAQNSHIISATILAMLMSIGTMSIVHNIHDIRCMKKAFPKHI